MDIITFAALPDAESSRPAEDRLLGGSPQQQIQNVFSDRSGKFFAGVWASTPGRWRIAYTENEFCHMLAGRVRITADGGGVWTFGPGDTFVVPAGFEGIWEVELSARKLYAIFEP